MSIKPSKVFTRRGFIGTSHPFNWRGWWDFGTWALGDIACHSLDPEKLTIPNLPEANKFLHKEYRKGWSL